MSRSNAENSGSHFGAFGCVVTLAAAMAMFTSGGYAQQVPTVLFSASAYGTTANVGSIVKVAKVAPVGVGSGCGTAEVPATDTGTAASVTALPFVTTGVVNTSASSSTGQATASADVHQISMLGGLISGEEVKAVSTTTVDSNNHLQSSAAGSTFVNLLILGQLVNGLPAPNTTINLAGFGSIVLNEQKISQRAAAAHLTVNMIHLDITLPNVLNIPVGTQVIVSDAASGIALISGPGALDGMSYGTGVYGKLLASSPTAPESVPCQGTKGIVKTNTLVGVNLPSILTSGTVSDTAEGDTANTGSNSQTSSTVQGLNLLTGLVTADVIFAEADGSTPDGMTFNFSSSGKFTNLAVAGHPEINDNVPPNTQVNIANLGTLYLNRVIQGSNNIENRMIELVVKQNNILGLPIGLDIRIAVAEASLHSKTHP